MPEPDSIALGPAQQETTVTQAQKLVQMWHDHLRSEVRGDQMADDTAKTYKVGARKFLQWCQKQGIEIAAVNRRVVLNWMASVKDAGRSVKTLGIWLTGTRNFFLWCISEELLPSDPTAGLKAGRKRIGERHTREKLSDKETKSILTLESLILRDKAAVWLMLYTAARGIELYRSNIEDFRTTDEGSFVIYVQGKGSSEKDEPLLIADERAVGVIKEYIQFLADHGHKRGPLFVTQRKFNGQYRRISRRTLQLMLFKAFEKAGIDSPTKTMHSLRHTALTNALKNGADIRQVQQTARHLRQQTTEIYVREKKRIENGAERFIDYKLDDVAQNS